MHENEEFGINFQRILIVMVILLYVFSYWSISEALKKVSIFGYEGKVSSVVLIEGSIINIIVLSAIIQNPVCRKHFIRTFTCQNETIQIVKIN